MLAGSVSEMKYSWHLVRSSRGAIYGVAGGGSGTGANGVWREDLCRSRDLALPLLSSLLSYPSFLPSLSLGKNFWNTLLPNPSMASSLPVS
ncbi:hypothetical protein E2C01_027009 [Portunus trituberculatus]|uniref:Uncharacterized protein n=1 Tax=Portunus trituberculatus TaxID=210409 RepID=A0A5B7EHM8_PORTR|nr:hypothetical protein [Portunus trituberculatus]